MTNTQPLACDFTAIEEDKREKHKKNGKQFLESVEEWTELFNGYALRIPAESDVIKQAGAFISLERLCCPFLKFNLEVVPNEGPIWLKLTGSKEVKKFIKKSVIPQIES